MCHAGVGGPSAKVAHAHRLGPFGPEIGLVTEPAQIGLTHDEFAVEADVHGLTRLVRPEKKDGSFAMAPKRRLAEFLVGMLAKTDDGAAVGRHGHAPTVDFPRTRKVLETAPRAPRKSDFGRAGGCLSNSDGAVGVDVETTVGQVIHFTVTRHDTKIHR